MMTKDFPTDLFDFAAREEERINLMNEMATQKTIAYDFFSADREARINRLEEIAQNAFLHERNDVGFRILDEIDRIREEQFEDEEIYNDFMEDYNLASGF